MPYRIPERIERSSKIRRSAMMPAAGRFSMIGFRARRVPSGALLSFLLALILAPAARGADTAPGKEAAASKVPEAKAKLLESRELQKGQAEQGLALSETHYYSSNAGTLCRFDTEWKLLEEKPIHVDGVNHLGAIHFHDGFLWAGLLHGPEKGQYDKTRDKAVVAKIRASDLTVEKTWDVTRDLTWIDPVCFDGRHLWIGDLRDLGLHRYRIDGDQLVREGTLRYPKAMHFSQGVRVVGRRLYSIHTFGEMKGLFEFDLPDALTETIQQPRRVWPIQETKSHLEGFDFLPGRPGEIWHAQGKQVDRYLLDSLSP